MKKYILVTSLLVIALTLGTIGYYAKTRSSKQLTIVEYSASQKEEYVQSQLKYMQTHLEQQFSGDISKTVKFVEENKGYTDIIKRPDGRLAILFTIDNKPTSFEIHTCTDKTCTAISEKLDGVTFYEGREKAKIFFNETPYDKIPNYAGTKESGAQYERYSITRLSDLVEAQRAEQNRLSRIPVLCGEPNIAKSLRDAIDLNTEVLDPTYRFPRTVTEREFADCWNATFTNAKGIGTPFEQYAYFYHQVADREK